MPYKAERPSGLVDSKTEGARALVNLDSEFLSTSIETLQHEGIVSIYPNPVKGVLHVDFENYANSSGSYDIRRLIISDIT